MKYVKVVGNFGGFIIDGIDADDRPDEVALKGSIRFTLLLDDRDAVLMPQHPQGSTIRVVDYFDVDLDADGDLSHRGNKYVLLPALDEHTNPKIGHYRVDFIGMTIAGRRINLRSIEIPAKADTVVDLTREFPVPGTPAPGVTRGEDGNSVTAVRRDGSSLVFTLDTTPQTDLPPVPLPEVDSLANWRDQAQDSATASATAAAESKKWAEAASATVLPDGSVAMTKLAAPVRDSLALADTASRPGHTHTIADIADLADVLNGKENIGAVASATSALRDGAPSSLDTLRKIAAAVGLNPNYASDTAAAIATKYSRPAGGIPSGDLADGAVTAAKLAEGGVTMSRLGAGRVAGKDKSGPRSLDVMVIAEADFQALTTKDPNTLYVRL
ncbi:hypothetical protein IU500_12480 [Nocardia terpenica]|uniref:phage upper tail fiber protein n=1 Tax=Nocardia terpenica TaxID=455432 RepID=UPI001894981D|nr:hypothetical protein [Nocardia terpenica]MBF6063006.1 hypothetical protein [Nocardia terpenica]MBF6104859.1 hypothetical protein [Nocardia terpenica]MBF6112704.1 hypothetical protein [Nocardia terpenica]MBF6118587.1 hypothetical protein [Nocardia terpenica]MBF6155066.1 hypothetical protein [Nocardia terpenica]